MLNKNFISRTISAVFILIFMLALVFINDYFLLVGTLFLSSLAIFELDKALSRIDYKLILIPAYIFNAAFICLNYFFPRYFILPLLSIYLLVLLIIMIFSDNIDINNVLGNTFIAVYITLSYSYFVVIRQSNWLLYMLGVASITDTFAYLVGVAIGKNKLYEKLSPKKTIEGSIGGIVGAIIFALVFNHFVKPNISIAFLLAMTLILSIISQLGDLIASYIKRKAGIKDYGYIFKGHGGVMDRFDSVLLLAPIIALIMPFV